MNQSDNPAGNGNTKRYALSTPDQFNDYIHVTGLNVWLILSAIALILIGCLIWGFWGSIVVSTSAPGIANNGVILCYVEDASAVKAGMEVHIGGQRGTVTDVSHVPMSTEQLILQHGDFIVHQLKALSPYSFAVTVEAGEVSDGIVQATIILERIRPISFLTNSVV